MPRMGKAYHDDYRDSNSDGDHEVSNESVDRPAPGPCENLALPLLQSMQLLRGLIVRQRRRGRARKADDGMNGGWSGELGKLLLVVVEDDHSELG